MTVHSIPAIPDKFKKGKKRNHVEPGTVAERIQAMKNRRIAAKQVGVKLPK
jgi:hypothetical protein